MVKPILYLAGKITNNLWRTCFYDVRNEGDIGKHNGINPLEKYVEIKNFKINGPYSISCDHSCAHVENTHTMMDTGCIIDGFRRDDILKICTEQIKNADLLFCFIDSEDCYGTLAEIGFAKALNKKIIIQFCNEDIRNNMWFASKMADFSIYGKSPINEDVLYDFYLMIKKGELNGISV